MGFFYLARIKIFQILFFYLVISLYLHTKQIKMIKLRPYQEEAVSKSVKFLLSKKTKNPSLLVAPTGTGKSIIIASIVSQLDAPALILQPSVELLKQNHEKYLTFNSECSIYSSSANERKISKATYATIGTIKSVPELFSEFKYLIIDEAHLYPPSNDSMFGNFIQKNSQLKILGLTATPFRLHSYMDGSKLVMMNRSHIYKSFLHIIQISEISKEYWCPIEYVLYNTSRNILKINTTGSEYTEQSVKEYGLEVYDKIKHFINTSDAKSILVFVPSISQANELAMQYDKAVSVSSKTKKSDRNTLIRDFKNGLIRIVFNVNILGVGFDFPELAYIIDANPTLSLARYYQKVGRLTRPHKNKLKSTYIDLAGNSSRFGRVEDLEIHNHKSMYHTFSCNTQLTGRYVNSIRLGEDNLTYFLSLKDKVALEEQISLSANQNFEDDIFDFGKHKGKAISDTPIDYLKWCVLKVTTQPNLIKNIKIFLQNK